MAHYMCLNFSNKLMQDLTHPMNIRTILNMYVKKLIFALIYLILSLFKDEIDYV